MRSAKLTEITRKHVHRRNLLPNTDTPAALVDISRVNNRRTRRLQAKQIRKGEAQPMIYTGYNAPQPFTEETARRFVILEGTQHG